MKNHVLIFSRGFLISWAGTLPPGIFTITVTHMAATGDQPAAWQFATGAMLAEVIVVRLVLSGMRWLSRKKKFFRLIEWMSIGLLVVFAAACFVTALREQDFSAITGKITTASFLTGFSLSLVNPLHIPFWVGWATLLLRKDILGINRADFNWFATGIGAGTLLGFWVYIDAGAYLLRLFHANQLWLQYGLGLLFLWVAVVQIRKQVAVPADRVFVVYPAESIK